MNILTLPGPQFLALYLTVLIAASIIAMQVRQLLLQSRKAALRHCLDHYKIAVLKAGAEHAFITALAMLKHREIVDFDCCSRVVTRTAETLPRDLHPLEQEISRHIPNSGKTAGAVYDAVKFSFESRRNELHKAGLIAAEDHELQVRLIPAALTVSPMLFSLPKLAVGLQGGKPVSILILLIGLNALIGFLFLYCNHLRTSAGENVLKQLETEADAHKLSVAAVLESKQYIDLRLVYAVFGSVSGSTADAYNQARALLKGCCRHGSGSSDGGSAIGWADAGGGSGGCGGGGCGGCGGGD